MTDDIESETETGEVAVPSDPSADEAVPADDAVAADEVAAADPHVGRGLLDETMGPSSALAHLYRGEIHRMTTWRERLDRTTNWAVIVLAATLTWAFSSPDNPHYVLLAGVVAIGAFLGIEAHRYRGFDIWRSRVRVLQANVFAYGLDPTSGLADEDWRSALSRDYRTPTFRVSVEEAVAHRLRRVYLPLLGVALVAWVIRITAFATAAWPASASIGRIPGVAVTGIVALVVVAALVVAFRPRSWGGRGELR